MSSVDRWPEMDLNKGMDMEPAPTSEPVEGAGGGLWATLAESIEAAPEPATNLWASLRDID